MTLSYVRLVQQPWGQHNFTKQVVRAVEKFGMRVRDLQDQTHIVNLSLGKYVRILKLSMKPYSKKSMKTQLKMWKKNKKRV